MAEALTYEGPEGIDQTLEGANTTEDILDTLDDEALLSLEQGSLEDVRAVVEMLIEDNPALRPYLVAFQNANSEALVAELRRVASNELSEPQRQETHLQIEIPNSLRDTLNSGELDLSIQQALGDIEEYMRVQLALPDDSSISGDEYNAIFETIGKLIQNNIGDIENIITQAQEENPELTLRELTWIINEKVSVHFDNLRAHVIPALKLYITYSGKEERASLDERMHEQAERAYVSQRHPNPDAPVNRAVDDMVESRCRSISREHEYLERIMRTMFIDGNIESVDELKRLDSSMGILGTEYYQTQKETRENLDVSLLNEADKQIESEAMCYFLFAVGIQCLPYAGAIPGIAADATDMFSSQDATMMSLKEMGLVPNEFNIDKTNFDRFLAGAGIVLSLVGLQAVARSKKLAKAIQGISRISTEQIGTMLSNFGEKMGLPDESIDGMKGLFGIDDAAEIRRVDEVGDIGETISRFSPDELQRLERAGNSEGLSRTLNDTEKRAIIEAHNIGERLPDGTYSLPDLREKVKLLREAGFTSGEIRTLFDKNICGTEYPKFANIYEDPRFDYLATDEYASVRDVLGENFSGADIIGEGANAIIFKDPMNPNFVLKVAKPGNTDELLQEFQIHQAFSSGLRDLQAKYKGTPEGEMLNNFTIPEARLINEDIGILQMDKVEGHTFRTLTALDFNKEHIGRVFPDGVEGLSDFQIDERLRAEGLRVYYRDTEEMYNIQDNLDDWGEVVELEIMYERGAEKQMRPFFDLMKREGYDHFDSHWGNIMMGRDGRINLIDFGRSRLTNN